MQKVKIQIVEDENIFAMDLVTQLESMDFSVVSVADNGKKAIQEAEKENPDLILMDIKLKDEMDGIETAQYIKSQKNIPIVFLTAYADEETLKRAKIIEPFGYLLKPINKRELKAVIEMALYKHRMEEKIRASEQRYRKLVESTMDLLFVVNSSANIVDVNQMACEKTGYSKEELLHISINDLGIGDQKENEIQDILQQLTHTRSITVEDTLQGKNGTTFPVELHIGLLSSEKDTLLLALARDITVRKQHEEEKLKLEKQLLQAQKMEDLGRLAGGVAHDFNNMLTVVQGYSEMALLNVDHSSPLYNDLKEINNAAHSAAGLTRQLLLFSRHQPMDFSLVNINTVINNLLKMLNRLLRENIVIETVLKKNVWSIWGDTGSIEQIMMNFIINAKDAIHNRGKITIKTDNVTIDKSDIDKNTDAEPGKYVMIEVKDTGEGMDEKTMKKIFTPLFTTKEPGKGTGLGLSVVNDIVKNNNGWISVKSNTGKGSTFTVYFPACFKKGGKVEEKTTTKLLELKGEGEHILLVEDENLIREFAATVLEQNGYKVTVTATAKQALEELNKNDDFQLLFTDMILPDNTGVELANKIREIKPHIPVLLSSGYTDSNLRKTKEKEILFDFIQKPYNIVSILRSVKKILGQDEKKTSNN
ncbi:MAG: response regulator [bacterium]